VTDEVNVEVEESVIVAVPVFEETNAGSAVTGFVVDAVDDKMTTVLVELE